MYRTRLSILLLALCAAPVFASQPAQNTPIPPAWEQLSQAERELLVAPVRERWNANPAQRARMGHRVEIVTSDFFVIAPMQPDDGTVEQIERRNELHEGSFAQPAAFGEDFSVRSRRTASSSASPACWLFSGLNCVASSGPRASTAVTANGP